MPTTAQSRFKLISSDGKIEFADSMTLGEMQKFVGGYIEYSANAIINEEGIWKNLPRNKIYPQFVGNVIIDQKMRVRKEIRVI